MKAPFAWTDAQVREALGLEADPRARELRFSQVSTDTRDLGEGALFVALEGERFDGHDFLKEAEDRGAGGAVVSDPGAAPESLPVYTVPDTLVALGDLARHRRRALPARVVGITGSSGKTAVKDLLAAALSPSLRVHATRGNLNNRVGLPLTLLAASAEAEMVIAELGTNEPGEIATLTAIAEPDAALVTTLSEAHLEGLGSLEGVAAEKLALVEGTRTDGPVLVGDDPPLLPERARQLRPDVRVAGLSAGADPELRGELLEADSQGRFRVRFQGREVEAGVPGRHGAGNLLLALAMAQLLGVDLEVAAGAAAAVGPGPLRGEMVRVNGLRLLLDCYNANPQSVRAALRLLTDLPGGGEKVAFLGSMLELGPRAPELHREVLDEALELPLCAVVAVGEFRPAAETTSTDGGPLLLSAPTPGEGYERLRPYLTGTETVLLKGSRGVALEELVPRFRRDFGSDPDGGEAA